MKERINRDTQLCISMSARPSNIGTRFHNFLYESLDLNFVYKAFAPVDIEQAVAGIRGLGIRGAAVSMPFKAAVIDLIDSVHPTAAVIGAVNTIVNDGGILTGYNTDFIAVRALLDKAQLEPATSVAVLGSGGMARAVVAAAVDIGLQPVVVARNEKAGAALASQYECEFSSVLPQAAVVINATPIGMAGAESSADLPIPVEAVSDFQLIFDVVAMPVRTPLIIAAEQAGVEVITGREVMTLQAVEQFEIYTGVRPTPELIQAAENFAHAV